MAGLRWQKSWFCGTKINSVSYQKRRTEIKTDSQGGGGFADSSSYRRYLECLSMKFPRVRNATKVRYGAWHSTQRHKVSQWTKVLLLRLFSTSHVGLIHFTQFAALISKCSRVNHEYVTNTHYARCFTFSSLADYLCILTALFEFFGLLQLHSLLPSFSRCASQTWGRY